MKAYELETQRIVRRFIDREISFPDCIAALDAALANLIPEMPAEALPALRAIMLSNNEIVMKEMERRSPISVEDYR